jgi:MoaA/NifB/PqqE/SkfB family radical SAM enzyme
MDTETAKRIILQAKQIGARSFGFGGGGDPSCHPELASILRYTKSLGLESSVSTNGYKLSDDVIEAIASSCTWARISLDAANPEMYSKIHGMPGSAFHFVIRNIQKIVSAKRENKSDIVFGITYLIDAHTIKGAYSAAKLVKEIGVDNIRFRPFFNWDSGSKNNSLYHDITRELKHCSELSDQEFLVSYPKDRIDSLGGAKERRFLECHTCHFATIVTPDCKVYPCCMLEDDEKYCYGDVSKISFKELWDSSRRKRVCKSIDLHDCPNPCMMEIHNELLAAIKSGELKNFSLKDIIKAMNAPIQHSNWI